MNHGRFGTCFVARLSVSVSRLLAADSNGGANDVSTYLCTCLRHQAETFWMEMDLQSVVPAEHNVSHFLQPTRRSSPAPDFYARSPAILKTTTRSCPFAFARMGSPGPGPLIVLGLSEDPACFCSPWSLGMLARERRIEPQPRGVVCLLLEPFLSSLVSLRPSYSPSVVGALLAKRQLMTTQ